MLLCAGCGGRNPPDFDVCSFCNRRLDGRGTGAPRPRRLANIVLATLLLLLLLLASVVLFVARSASVV
jgi:hypothetical protein